MHQKKEIRRHIRNQFQHTMPEKRYKEADVVYQHLFQSSVWKEAATIAVTMSTRNEIDTEPVIKQAWKERKRTAVPKTNPLHETMTFYHITSFKETKQDFAGIWEPEPDLEAYVSSSDFDLIIVPGMAFDKEKYRIGFGGGYYDRFLQTVDAPTCAILYSFQFFERIPREDHDIPIDFLCVSDGIF
ncbi:5-formyltetrahydrofolate cyclo-ligase [Salibacterium halotolerans]|uniref:5-formyltetrahydrofolate cyclo-ligase n=1 Tax=Salibacterium halotolerans TaxID=1884432 RepID=A0A1I5NJR0_9BACI|nr:5-formyltetrahydrofolate cyclo-ligase [Salibacterium halotolerans]SFP22048.1 5-formyltetrahydrofolate cyclo-ligase [Salibacterium halotolerans]